MESKIQLITKIIVDGEVMAEVEEVVNGKVITLQHEGSFILTNRLMKVGDRAVRTALETYQKKHAENNKN